MLKLCGVMITILTSAVIGEVSAQEIEASYEELCYLKKIILKVQSEMKYSRSFLSGVFKKISGEVKEPYASLFLKVSGAIENHQMQSFEQIWEEQIERQLACTKLQKKEKDRLKEIGKYLGEADLQMQLRLMDGYLEQLDLSIGDMRRDMENRKKLCRSIGLFGGIFISILLI